MLGAARLAAPARGRAARRCSAAPACAARRSFLIWTVEASVYLAVAHATGLDISVMGALYLVALTNLFAMIPAAPGYVGTFDAAVIFGVKAIGGTESAALAYLLLLRFILFVPITVVGLVLLVVRYGGWSACARPSGSRPAAPRARLMRAEPPSSAAIAASRGPVLSRASRTAGRRGGRDPDARGLGRSGPG